MQSDNATEPCLTLGTRRRRPAAALSCGTTCKAAPPRMQDEGIRRVFRGSWGALVEECSANDPGSLVTERDIVAECAAAQVRKTPNWPRSWANFSLLSLYIPTGMYGPTCIFWASLTPLSPQTAVLAELAATCCDDVLCAAMPRRCSRACRGSG